MSGFQLQALELAAQQTPMAWMSDIRHQGATRFADTPWPNRRTESWKYTSLNGLKNKVCTAINSDTRLLHSNEPWLSLNAHRLVFVNGVFNAAASTSAEGLCVLFQDANEQQQQLIQKHLGRLADSEVHLFAALSEASLNQGVFLHVPENLKLDKPVYIVHLTSENQPTIASQRVLVVVEAHAEVEIIEHFLTDDNKQNGFVNAQTEIILNNNAKCQHYRLNMGGETVSHVGGVFVELLRSAEFRGFAIAKGSELMRIDYGIFHRGEGAHVDLQGVYLPHKKQRVDYHTNVQHCVPHCTTREVFRGIIGDDARAVFNGRIHIHPNAQKTLAELSNKNLLTSKRAEVNTKPELEIYADDVKCAHGATVSQIDDETLYYLQSRGVSKANAKIMLSFAFINELLQDISDVIIADYLVEQLSVQFGRDNTLLALTGDEFA